MSLGEKLRRQVGDNATVTVNNESTGQKVNCSGMALSAAFPAFKMLSDFADRKESNAFDFKVLCAARKAGNEAPICLTLECTEEHLVFGVPRFHD